MVPASGGSSSWFPGQILKAPSPGEKVEVFEIPESTSPDPNLEVPMAREEEGAPNSILCAIERAQCDSIKDLILSIPRIKEEFERAEKRFPEVKSKLPAEKALDQLMSDLITSKQGQKGIDPEAEVSQIRCYKLWLSRVERGSKVDDFSYTYTQQSYRNDIDIKEKILPFYSRMAEKMEDF